MINSGFEDPFDWKLSDILGTRIEGCLYSNYELMCLGCKDIIYDSMAWM